MYIVLSIYDSCMTLTLSRPAAETSAALPLARRFVCVESCLRRSPAKSSCLAFFSVRRFCKSPDQVSQNTS